MHLYEKLRLHLLLISLIIAAKFNHIRYAMMISEKVSELDPNHPTMLKNMAMLFMRGEREIDCLRMSERLLEQRPLDPFSHALLSDVYRRLGRLQEELQHLILAWELADGYINPLKRRRIRKDTLKYIRVNIEIQEEEGYSLIPLSLPVSELEKVKLKPWEFQESYGEYLFCVGRKGEALEHFKEEVTMASSLAFPYVRIGWILAERGKFEEASYYLKKALRCLRNRKTRPYGRVWLAYCYYHLGSKKKARFHLYVWDHQELARGSDKDRIRAACLYRALGSSSARRSGSIWLKQVFSFSPDPDLLVFLRQMEDELGLERMSIKDLGGAQELYAAEEGKQEANRGDVGP
jgi:tetratricopeptide (TPR) repeat protein